MTTNEQSVIETEINKMAKKYAIHDLTKHNHLDRLKMFLDDLKESILKLQYK